MPRVRARTIPRLLRHGEGIAIAEPNAATKPDSRRPHPSFRNPSVVEAFCELHFAPPASTAWKATWFSDFFVKIQSDFPKMEPQQVMQVATIFRPGEAETRLPPPTLRMIYRHKERPHLAQLSPGLLAVNELRPYAGWDSFLRDIERAWTDLRSVLPDVALKRIGLRYINRVPRASAEEPVSTWLAESVFYPEKLLALTSRFLSRFEFEVSPGFRSIITVGDASEGEEAETRFLLLDLDSVLEGAFPSEWGGLAEELNRVHDHLWEVFSSTLTPRFKAHLGEA